VIWEFGGAPIPRPLLDDVRRVLRRSVPEPLAELLDAEERAALLDRARAVIKTGRFPQDTSGRQYPWPLV